MGYLARMSTIAAPARVRGQFYDPFGASGMYTDFAPLSWVAGMGDGSYVSPELALTLSHVYCAVDTISSDFGVFPCGLFRDLGDDGRQRVRFSDAGIGALAYRLRWQPNGWQSAKAFWSCLCWQYLLRPAAYAEIIYRPGSDSIIDQLIPRHPDRVEEQRLPGGRLRYKLTEPRGLPPRYITQEEMFVVRNTSTDGLNAISRVQFGAKAISTGMALQDFTRIFFRKGITGALLATYKGRQMEDEDEDALHKSISRFASGVENAGGVLLVPEDIDVKALGVDPDKAQLLGLKDLGGRDVARLFKMPPRKLGIAGAQSYASAVQDAIDYVTACQMPIVTEFQQAIYIHLIVAREYYAKFNTSHLLLSDPKSRMEAHEIAIRARVYRPSEARVMEDMSPDEELDRLSALDHRTGSQRDGQDGGRGNETSTGARLSGYRVKTILAMHDNAIRVLRRERAAVEKLAKKHASNVEGWQAGLRDFYADHAGFIADTMRLPMRIARAVAAQHGDSLERNGVVVMDDRWERSEAEELVTLALEPDAMAALAA